MKTKRIALFLAIPLGLFIMLGVVILAYSSSISKPLYDETLDPGTLDTINIADVEQALTFARCREDDSLQVLLVRNYQKGMIEGINLNKYFNTDKVNPIDIFTNYGYKKIRDAFSSGFETHSVSATELEIPIDAGGPHIGIGTNYRAHAREVQAAGDEPFIFPKHVKPTHFTSGIPSGDSPRLDYEAELGFVILSDIMSESAFPEFMGLVLCNDFTDRWTLIRTMKRNTEMGTTGFPDGKGKGGFMPIGNLFVIPRDLKSFYPDLELNLYLNGRLRQRAKAGLMIWGPSDMIEQTFLRSTWTFHSERGEVSLLPDGKTIPAGTIILSGTPGGVIFRIANVWNGSLYLASGDEVIVRSDKMGIIKNTITD